MLHSRTTCAFRDDKHGFDEGKKLHESTYPKNHQLKAAFLFYIIMNLIASGLFFNTEFGLM